MPKRCHLEREISADYWNGNYIKRHMHMDSPQADSLALETFLPPAVWRSFRDGGVLLLGAFLGGLFCRMEHGNLFWHLFLWVPFAFVVFPAGAALGWFLPRWVARRSWAGTVGLGLLLGLLAGLVFAALFWTLVNSGELIGLITNRGSGGYESYRFSVKKGLWENAQRVFSQIPVIALIWITGWTLVKKVSARKSVSQDTVVPAKLPGGKRLLLVWGALAVGFALYALGVVLLGMIFIRGMHGSGQTFLFAGPAGAGLVVLGPFLGPIANPAADHFALAWRFAAFGIPAWLAALVPFLICSRPLSPGAQSAAWCGWVTAILFWIFLGFGVGLHCLS